MQNEMMNLMQQYSENSLATAQRMTELNIKTFETLSAKQAELFNSCYTKASKNVEALTKAKDYKDLVELQKAAVSDCSEMWVSAVRNTTETLTGVREEMGAIYEEARIYTTESVEKASELSQQAVQDNIRKAAKAGKKAA